ncbi:MAG: hypothetical protein NT118_06865, partial [Lentisphaerae bacterium]|nr:hypothetical protein [Lentisphaerota bacterium]
HVSQQMYSAPAGSKVACSVWVKTSKPETEYLIYWDITAQREGRDPEWFSGHNAGLQKNANTEWKEVKFSFTAPADKVDKDGNFRKICFFFLRLSTPDKYSGDIWFDDVSVVVTPPSSSISEKVVSEPLDPSKIRWEMNSGDELASTNNFDDVTYNDGEFSGKTKYDPSICLSLPTNEIDANDYKILKIRLYSSAMFSSLDVFYSSPNKEWCMGSADVKIEQGWKEYVIDLNKVKWRAEEASSANAAKWGGTTGKVSAVRIDPGNEADRIVKVDWVELLKK